MPSVTTDFGSQYTGIVIDPAIQSEFGLNRSVSGTDFDSLSQAILAINTSGAKVVGWTLILDDGEKASGRPSLSNGVI